MENRSQTQRNLYMDILRIAATIAVIFFHQGGVVENPDIPWSYTFWQIFIGTTRWCVPIFVMISGALFLDNNKPLSLQKLYFKNILRIVTAFLFWSAVYGAYHYSSPMFFLETMFMGRYHMWFLFMIVGLYIITPLLRKITADKKMTEYFLIISLIFGIGVYTFNMTPLSKIAPGVSDYVFDNLSLGWLAGYMFFFVLGYYLHETDFGKSTNVLLILFGIVGCILSIILTVSAMDNNDAPKYYVHFFLPVVLECVAVFLIGKLSNKNIVLSDKVKKVIFAISKYSFGIYLSHDLVLTIIRPWVLNVAGALPVIALLLSATITIAVSLVISFVLNHIPVLKKYIV